MSNVTRIPAPAAKEKKVKRSTTPFKEFAPYEDRRVRNLKFDVNALADFEQETGMGFAQLMKQRAVFASARAMLWAGLKHEDRALRIEDVGDLLSEYLKDEEVPQGAHNIDAILMVAIAAAIEQGALGRQKEEAVVTEDDGGQEGNVLPALESDETSSTPTTQE